MSIESQSSTKSGAPLGYFISFRCYGTWLHGDDRGSVDLSHNIYRTPMPPPDEQRRSEMRSRMKHDPVELTATRRAAVEEGVRENCDKRGWVCGRSTCGQSRSQRRDSRGKLNQ